MRELGKFDGWAHVLGVAVAAVGCHPAPASRIEAVAQKPKSSSGAPAATSARSAAARASATATEAEPPAPLAVATRLPASTGQARSVRASGLVLGERWGCARVSSEGAAAWQCWNAASGASAQPPHAFRVPWLDGKSTLLAGPARLCAYEKPALTLRCWRPPVAGQTAVELGGRDELRCVGAVPTPRDGFGFASVSPGQDASACSLKDGAVRCWGEAYSSPKALSTAVTIVLEQPPVASEVAVLGAPSGEGWDDACLIKHGCTLVPTPLPPCPADMPARDWAELVGEGSSLLGKRVQVRGPLGVGALFSTMKGCFGGVGRTCCNSTSGSVVLGGASMTLALEGLYCSGDESQVCCNAPAYGQAVVATGILTPAQRAPNGAAYRLTGVNLCAAP